MGLGNCQFLKNFGQISEAKCNSPNTLNSIYLKDALRTHSQEVSICQKDSQYLIGNFMDSEEQLSFKITQEQKELKSLGSTHIPENADRRSKILGRLKVLSDERREVRNHYCRLETCGHLLKCRCDDCFKRQGVDDNVSSLTVFSSKGYRRNTLNFHQQCFYIAVRRIGVNVPMLGKQKRLEENLTS